MAGGRCRDLVARRTPLARGARFEAEARRGTGPTEASAASSTDRRAKYPRRREDGVWTSNLRGVVTTRKISMQYREASCRRPRVGKARVINRVVRRSSPVLWTEFTTDDDGPLIAGRRAGTGPRILLLHGGPGLSFEYLRDLAEELATENDVAWYQQRGQQPSAAEGPYTVAADVGDARRVLDALDWQRAYLVGHSWGGHLALHVAQAMPERLLGVLAVDPLG